MKKNNEIFRHVEIAQAREFLLSRRKFLGTAGYGLGALASSALFAGFGPMARAMATPASDLPTLGGVSILQGFTDATSTLITLVVPQDSNYAYRALTESDDELKPESRSRATHARSAFAVDKIRFTGLEVGRTYRLQVVNELGGIIDERRFGALDLDKNPARIALISCANDLLLVNQALMWSKVTRQAPDALFFVGDAIYADTPLEAAFHWGVSPNTLWKRHVENRMRILLYYSSRLIPTLAVWDDHDFGQNNGTSSYMHKAKSKEIFRTFFPLPENHPTVVTGPGVAFSLRAFGQRFVFLDDRTFRVVSVLSPNRTQWGEEQQDWMAGQLGSAEEPTWLLNGSMFFGAYQKGESVQKETPDSLQFMIDAVRGCAQPVALCAGDVHYSETMAIPKEIFGYPSAELVSSAIHSASAGPTIATQKNPWRLDAYGFENFLLVETKAAPGKLLLDTQCVSLLDSSAFQRKFQILR